MKMAVSDRDKRMLLLLAAFFAALGYFYLAFAPLQEFSERSAKELDREDAELQLRQAKIAQFKSWQDCHERLAGRTARIYKALKAPSAERPLPEQMDAIMRAAASSGVELESLKPVSEPASQDGEQEARPPRSEFMLDGTCSPASFLKLIRELYGMKISQFALSSDSEGGRLRFHLMLEALEPLPPLPRGIELDRTPAGDYKLDGDLFSAKPAAEEESAPAASGAPKGSSLLEGLKLNGTARIANADIAVISDSKDSEARFRCYRVGDELRGARVAQIREGEALLAAKDGSSCPLRFSSSAATPAPQPKVQKQARLGLRVDDADPGSAKRAGLPPGKTGLLVLESKPGCEIRKDDVITGIAGEPVASAKEALAVIRRLHSGDAVKMAFFRDGKELEARIKFE